MNIPCDRALTPKEVEESEEPYVQEHIKSINIRFLHGDRLFIVPRPFMYKIRQVLSKSWQTEFVNAESSTPMILTWGPKESKPR